MEQLYTLNSHYFEDHGVECAGRKESDVRDKMQATLTTLESLKGTYIQSCPQVSESKRGN